jgi:hypothetical protein
LSRRDSRSFLAYPASSFSSCCVHFVPTGRANHA